MIIIIIIHVVYFLNKKSSKGEKKKKKKKMSLEPKYRGPDPQKFWSGKPPNKYGEEQLSEGPEGAVSNDTRGYCVGEKERNCVFGELTTCP